MDKMPHFVSCMTFCDPNKKELKEWIWKIHKGSFCKDHSIRGSNFDYIGFWTKAGTNYYASILSPKGV